MSYLDLSDRRVEFTAVLDPRERRKSIVGRRVAVAKEKKRGRKEKKGGGNITYSGEKEESGRKNGEIRGCVTGSIMKSLWAYLKLL